MSAFLSELSSFWQQAPVAAFTQEIVVLVVFALSFLLWRRVKGPTPRHKKVYNEKVSSMPSPIASSTLTRSAANQVNRGDGKLQRRSVVPSSRLASQAAVSSPEMPPAAVKAVEEQLIKHLEQSEFTRALNMYRTYERDNRDRFFSEELFSTFIQSAIRVGKVDVVERMLRTMRRNNLQPSLKFWQTTLKMLSSRKHFSACMSANALFGKQIPADKTIYSCLINASLESGHTDRAVALLQRYGEAAVDAKDHVLFFRTYVAAGDVASAEACFRKLGSQTTTLMLNLLLLTCVNAKESERAHSLLQQAHMFEAQKRSGDKIVDVVSYNTVIKGYMQEEAGPQCFDCLREMLDQGVEPDDITFGTLLDACIGDPDSGKAHEIVSLLMGRARGMDVVMCTLFMKALVRANCLPKALELYDEMQKRDGGSHPDVVTYSVLIKALVDQHDLDRALQLLADLLAAKLQPDDIILTHLLEGCRHVGNHALGKKLFEELVAVGVKPSEFTLVTMLKLHGRCGAHKEAFDLVAGWESKYGIRPSVIHYTCIMSGCLRSRKYDQAWGTYKLMTERGIPADETTVTTLLPGLVVAQMWDQIIDLVQSALGSSKRVEIPAVTLNNALSQMLLGGAARRHWEKLQLLMREAGVPVTVRGSASAKQQRAAA
eukprot:TRINITY_DN19532_c0_g1_i1.p1 TRINITY_DN19532_c0_g1~~TRINITY_DN19532_c0_g1_i1.p1  ORF type:complete len:657 (+),score=211.78 TRINITY_DN19532_c0_g1_i1:129-2099(+)